MNHTYTPDGYKPILNLYETQLAISMVKRLFADNLCAQLNLRRVSAPLFLESKTGLNDNLNGVERPVDFDVPATGGSAQVVQSLAKWKRMALYNYGFKPDTGLLTDMNAIRRDEELDNIHSIYVDQWDWERVITPEERNLDFLRSIVGQIVFSVCQTEKTLRALFPQLMLHSAINPVITYITAQQLEDKYPGKTPKERENEFLREHKTAFIMQIGGKLKSGAPHDGRAPDYDDWKMNGDLLFWNDTLGCSFELSSMGIRVDPETLDKQLREAGCDDRRNLTFHRALLNGELPLTIGGGIGQSRLCMLLLGNAHIGEVQSSVWDDETRKICKKAGIPIL